MSLTTLGTSVIIILMCKLLVNVCFLHSTPDCASPWVSGFVIHLPYGPQHLTQCQTPSGSQKNINKNPKDHLSHKWNSMSMLLILLFFCPLVCYLILLFERTILLYPYYLRWLPLFFQFKERFLISVVEIHILWFSVQLNLFSKDQWFGQWHQ